MILFLICVAALIAGYFIYGAFVEKVFGVTPARPTPAHSQKDGVDFVPMSTPKVYLVQLLNIAGVGPIFGPIMGALYGPAAMLWIVLVHFCRRCSRLFLRHAVSSQQWRICAAYLAVIWAEALTLYELFAIVLLLLVGVVFVSRPQA